MSTHPQGEQISAYLDSMLDVARMREVAAHLRGCASCQTIADELQTVKAQLHEMTAPTQPSPEIWTGAYRRLRVAEHDQAASRGSAWEQWRQVWQTPQRRWGAGLAAVTVLSVLIAAPLHKATPPYVLPPAPAAQDLSPDVSALVQAHTDSVARLPLADPNRQTMIAADAVQPLPPNTSEAAGYADASF